MRRPSDATKRMARIMGCEFTSDKFKLYDHELALQRKRDAAPGLYDMLEIATRTIEIFNETLKGHGHDVSPSAEDVVLACRAILAKARGEA